jgi:glutamate synthase domain-containing protein 2
MLARGHDILVTLFLAGLAAAASWFESPWGLLAALVLAGLAAYDRLQRRDPARRNYPLLGRIYAWLGRWPGSPGALRLGPAAFDPGQVALIRARAEGVKATVSFGAESPPGAWALWHSFYPREPFEVEDRVRIGGPKCPRPYDASVLQLSALSFGAISDRAILALGRGARAAGAACNTGEGGLPAVWLDTGCDLIWQIGTSYFGCRTPDGHLDPALFAERAALPQIRMIELKLSQGGKPGAGGMLLGSKVTPAIAAACGIPAGIDSLCPSRHPGCETPEALLELLARLRSLAGGKPTGIKLCLGRLDEWQALCRAMERSQIVPDFVALDGAEGGAGAAPLELMRHVGRPLDEALPLVHESLLAAGVREKVRIVASGKVVTGHDLVRRLAQGADVCASARPFLLALGCVQALQCQNNTCPTGITTQDGRLGQGLVIDEGARRAARYHAETVQAYRELMAARGARRPEELRAPAAPAARGHLHLPGEARS